jgi:hypothetical protein
MIRYIIHSQNTRIRINHIQRCFNTSTHHLQPRRKVVVVVEPAVNTEVTKIDSKLSKLLTRYKKMKKEHAQTQSGNVPKDVSVSETSNAQMLQYAKKKYNKRKAYQTLQENALHSGDSQEFVNEKLHRLFPSIKPEEDITLVNEDLQQDTTVNNDVIAAESTKVNNNGQFEDLVSKLFDLKEENSAEPIVVNRKQKISMKKIPVPDELVIEDDWFSAVLNDNVDSEATSKADQKSSSELTSSELYEAVKLQLDNYPDRTITEDKYDNTLAQKFVREILHTIPMTPSMYEKYESEFIRTHFQRKELAHDNIKQNTLELANPDIDIDPEIRRGVTSDFSLYQGVDAAYELNLEDEEEIELDERMQPKLKSDSLGYSLVPAEFETTTPGLVLNVDRVVSRKPATAKSEIDFILGDLETDEQIEVTRINRAMIPGGEGDDMPRLSLNIQGEHGFGEQFEKMSSAEMGRMFGSSLTSGMRGDSNISTSTVQKQTLDQEEENELLSDDEDEDYSFIIDDADGYTPIPKQQSSSHTMNKRVTQLFEDEDQEFERIISELEKQQ